MDMGSWPNRVSRRARLSFPRPAFARKTAPEAWRAASAIGPAVAGFIRALPRSVLLGGAGILTGVAVIIALTAGGVTAQAGQDGRSGVIPEGGGPPVGSSAGTSVPPVTADAFSGIVLPDLLIVMPSGLAPSDLVGLRAIPGVRKMISFDGAQITVAGQSASVIGVNPDRFRSWVPLRAASDQAVWAGLAGRDFIASSPAAARLGLSGGSNYALVGRSPVTATYAGSAWLNIAGVDLLVNQATSRKLGLVHRVAALISAPGPRIATLIAHVHRVLGANAKVVDLRGQRLPVRITRPAEIASYLQLFQASAARYCPQMSWTVLAAIGQIESADGQNMGPSSAGALGPMQFMPATWAAWGIRGFGRPGRPDIMNPFDAVPSAARMLCADGASSGTPAGLRQAIFAYNHATWYVNDVLALAGRYAAEYH
jgi:Transglycosylase SLT domain